VVFKKGEKYLTDAAHWLPPFGAKGRKRSLASCNNSSVMVKYTALELGSV